LAIEDAADKPMAEPCWQGRRWGDWVVS